MACTKRGYGSESAAKEAHKHAGYRLRAYRCHLCNQWHTANADKGEPLAAPLYGTRRHPKRRVMGLAPERTLAEVEAIAAEKRGRMMGATVLTPAMLEEQDAANDLLSRRVDAQVRR